ncbi:Cytochrome c oxidase subunit 3 (fragment) (mitochondrion) [Sporisorium reilianum SRZ2]|uniref:Cytochrome c oxidase subunit 3 n=1 Tax=Sporisorium reilianum (strain SRZ2) TaxID=999809 RepID=E6ZZ93_SPORE
MAGIATINPFELPLLNTILLLSSGATVTYAHHSVIEGNRRGAILGTLMTLIFAVLFTICQGIEYVNAGFTIADGVFGSTFFWGSMEFTLLSEQRCSVLPNA